MEYHETANLFPMMNDDELGGLVNSMSQDGYDKTCPIVLLDGKILDGRNRQKAADIVGIEPCYTEYTGDDPLGFVIRHNLTRRHLNESQRAVVASRLATMKQGQRTDLQPSANLHNVNQAKAAELLNVSPRIIASVKAIERDAPEMIARIESGKVSVNEAQKEIKKAQRNADIETQKITIKENSYEPPTKLFDVIVVDPPWNYGTEYDPDGRRAANPYPEMTLEEISAIKLPASENCVLWLWTTHKFMRHAFGLLDGWGFRDVAILTWVKSRMGLGSWLRSQSEFCIMAVKGKPVINLTNQTTIINGDMREHSRKPDEFYAMVEGLCPGYKIDWFSREKRDGWSQYGNDLVRFT